MASGKTNSRTNKGSVYQKGKNSTSHKHSGKRSKSNAPLHSKAAPIAAQVQACIGAPVFTVLKDGTYRCGIIREIRGDQVILEGFEGTKKLPRNITKAKAQIAGLGGLGGMLGMLGGAGGMLGMLGSGLGGLAGGGGSGGLLGGLGKGSGGGAGFFGSMGRYMKIGMSVISFIMPLMKGFSI